MKKITLFILAFIAGIAIQAQSTSFEDSEGFVLGNLDGQNGWGVFAASPNIPVVTDVDATDGSFSIHLIPTGSEALSGGFSPVFTSSMDVVISADIFLESVAVGDLSDTDFITQSPSQGSLTSRVNFSFNGTVNVLDDPGTGLAFIDTGVPVIRDAWFELKIEHAFSSGQILYYIDDVLIYTGIVYGGTNVEQYIAFFDDFDSGTFFDNIEYEDGLLLSVDENSLIENNISIYPNPTQGDINIKFSKDFGNTNINIVNAIGQTVLSTTMEGYGSKTINTTELASGVYFAQIATDTGNTTIKFIRN